MSHPTSGELIELFFGELEGRRGEEVAAHGRACAACGALLADLEWAEKALAAGPGEGPPEDGLARVLARIDAARPVRARSSHWLRTAGPCAAALLAGSVAVHQGGAMAAVVFLAVGSIVTLALAPVLILESQRRS